MSKTIGSWQAQYLYLGLLNFAISLGIFTSTGDRAVAQITPDIFKLGLFATKTASN